MNTYAQNMTRTFAAALFVSLSGPVLAADTVSYQVKGEAANAIWSADDDCSSTALDLFVVGNAKAQEPTTADLYLWWNRFDYCNNVNYYIMPSETGNPSLQFSGKLTKSATLTGTYPISVCYYDYSNDKGDCEDGHTASLNLEWVGNKDKTRGFFMDRIRNSTGLNSFKGVGSRATASVSGSIVQDDGTSLISGDLAYADIGRYKSGVITIAHLTSNSGGRLTASTFGMNGVAPTSTLTATGSFTDPRDGQVYPTSTLGGKTWLARNLNFARNGSFCYNNDPQNCTQDGRFYNWSAAQVACPTGWHLPSDEEWMSLETALGMAADQLTLEGVNTVRGTDEGTKFKGDLHMSGYRRGSSYVEIGHSTYYWTSTMRGTDVWRRRFLDSQPTIFRFTNRTTGFAISVRCVSP